MGWPANMAGTARVTAAAAQTEPPCACHQHAVEENQSWPHHMLHSQQLLQLYKCLQLAR